jgi:hypothetical protein
LTCRGGSADRTAVFVVPHKQRKLLITIDKTVPADLDIHLVCDNYGTHKTPAIKAWLAKHPRVSHAGDTVSVPSGSWETNLG